MAASANRFSLGAKNVPDFEAVMLADVEKTIQSPDFLSTKFSTMAINSWCTTVNHEVFPAEIAITEFCLQVSSNQVLL